MSDLGEVPKAEGVELDIKERVAMKKIWILFTLLLIGCTSASISTPTIVPATSTKISTPTLIPISTPFPLLQTDGPYLLFTVNGQKFTMMDTDGSGISQFQLPDNGYTSQWGFEKFISPDGKWIAYFTGIAKEEPYDLTLNLFNIEDGKTIQITKLIAPEFPENLLTATEFLEFPNCPDIECKTSLFMVGFKEGIESLAWSPDSKQIAFSAQIDGFSSDIYIFNIEEKTIKRLSNEYENVNNIFWSPNGEKVLYDVSIEGSTYYIDSKWNLVDLTNTVSQSITELTEISSWRPLGWFNESIFLVSTAIDSPSYIDTMYIDINSKETNTIWPYIADRLILDSKNNQLIVSQEERPSSYYGDQQEEGIYLVNLDGSSQKISNQFFFLLSEQLEDNSHLGLGDNRILFEISINGNINQLANNISPESVFSISPNKNWIIFASQENKVDLYSSEFLLKNSWRINAFKVIWRPDSTGVFLNGGDKIYYLSMSDENLKVVYLCRPNDCAPFNSVWLP